jgi:hypothetical protein
VSRSHPEPAASIDGAVKMAELLNVHPGAVVPLKSCCSLNCAVAGATYAVKSKQLKESLVTWPLKSIFMDGYRSNARRSQMKSLRKSLTRKFWLVGDGGTITEV